MKTKKKKILNVLIVVTLLSASLFLLTGCVDKKSDAYKFKKEYESINNKDNGHGNKYRSLNIPNDNPNMPILSTLSMAPCISR